MVTCLRENCYAWLLPLSPSYQAEEKKNMAKESGIVKNDHWENCYAWLPPPSPSYQTEEKNNMAKESGIVKIQNKMKKDFGAVN